MSFFQDLEIINRNTSGIFNRQFDGRTAGNDPNDRYNSSTLQFPLDIGSADKGHYILFNINEQTKTQFSSPAGTGTPTVVANMKALQDARGSTNVLSNAGGAIGGVVSGLGGLVSSSATNIGETITKLLPENQQASVGSALTPVIEGLKKSGEQLGSFGNQISASQKSSSFLRTIQRIRDSIVLYMPDKISYTNGQSYGELKLGGAAISASGFAAGAAMLKDGEFGNLGTLAAFAASEKLPFGGKELGAITTAVAGVVKNPMLEVMYQGVALRKFNFSFSLWPRSEQEAIEVQKIIGMLRFHQAPEIKKNSGGFFLIPPSEFDIAFMYNGKVNPNIDAISTCVLTNIAVDYTPKGFHAFESIGSIDNPQLGKTGMPVGINLSLSFLETQIITKEYYKDLRDKNRLINSSNNSFP
jgi:hypothetical protein